MTQKPVGFTMKLELIPVPVTDIDIALDFYVGKVGFNVDHDVSPADGMRIVQLTPPGSSCSIALGKGIGSFDNMTPGNVTGIHLVVDDMASARETLIERGVNMGDVIDMSGVLYSEFSDPDNNTWLLQEIPANL